MSFDRLPDYDVQRMVQAHADRQRERRLARSRELHDHRAEDPASAGRLVRWSQVLSHLPRPRRILGLPERGAIPDAPPPSTQLITEISCRLADGSLGRVAILRASDDEWTAECVRV